MPASTDLATTTDVITVYRSLSADEEFQVAGLIKVASAKLRQAVAYDLDERIALFATNPDDSWSISPLIVANVVATIIKRFLVNVEGVTTTTEAAGPFSRSRSFVNRYDKTGSDVRGEIRVTAADLAELLTPPPTGPQPPIQTLPRFNPDYLQQDISAGYVL